MLNNVKNSILEGQLTLLRRQLWIVIGGNLGASGFTALVLWPFSDHRNIIIWVSCIYGWTLLRGLILFRFSNDLSLIIRVRLFGFLSFVSGVLWGSAAILFIDPSQPILVAFICIVLIGMTSTSVSSLSAYSPIYFAYALPTMLLLIWTLYFAGGLYTGLAALAFLSLGVNLLFSRNVERSLKETILLRFENADLIEKLEERIEDVARSRDKVQQANLAKSKFLAASSHDARQPLHALSLFVDSLRAAKNKGERNILMERIDDSVHALNGLFDGLLDISRLDAAVVEISEQNFSLRDLISELQSEFESLAVNKGVQLRIRMKNIFLYTDPFLLQRILRNLLSNALHYTENGAVLLTARQRGNEVLLEIRDTGIGIPKEEQVNIFTEFHQLGNPERDRRKGLGLGLAIVQRLCALLDLPITLRSWPGKGSLFCIRAPVGQETVVEITKTDLGLHNNLLKGQHVLVVDDEKTILEATVPVLKRWGCLVETARNLEEALISVRNTLPDVIFCDYRLRENVTGFDVIDSLRQQEDKLLPALIITGDTAPQIDQRAKENTIEVLHKPVLPAQLRIALNHVLQSTVSQVDLVPD